MEKEELKRIRYLLRILLVICIVVAVTIAIKHWIPDMIVLLKQGDEKALEQYIAQAGPKGMLLFVLLQVLQTITIVFPGIPIYVCAGIVYGKIVGTLLCYITYVASNFLVFLISRRLGEAAEELFPWKKQLVVADMMKKTKHPGRLVALLCVLPVIPNGIIPHLAAKSNLDKRNFLFAVALGCIPGICLFVGFGDLIINGHFELVVGVMILAAVGGVLFGIFKKQITTWVEQKFSEK